MNFGKILARLVKNHLHCEHALRESVKHTGVTYKSCFLASLEEHSICIVGLNFISLINVLLVTGESNLSFEMLLRFDGDTVCRVMSS
jgi:hypothetical protein